MSGATNRKGWVVEEEDLESRADSFASSVIGTEVVGRGMQSVSEVIHTATMVDAAIHPVSEAYKGHPFSKKLLDEMRIRFPEILRLTQDDEDDEEEESPWVVMCDLVIWLDSKGECGFDATLIQRLVEFAQWCELQPRGKDASDDIYSFLVVGLYEGLLLSQHTKSLIPHLMPKSRLEANKQYLVTWVGQDNYDKALEQFNREGTQPGSRA